MKACQEPLIIEFPSKTICENHTLWRNPLLIACSRGQLSLPDFRYLFSQYYHYTKSFTRLLATIMVKCENDVLRAKLTRNLWEESGENNPSNSHAEIFRTFLIDALGLKLDSLVLEVYTREFVNRLINLCLESEPAECAAILAYATEGIVSRLYSIFKTGLHKAGLKENQLQFFSLHIACDDEHAETLDEIVKSYEDVPNWHDRCNKAISAAMELRDKFFEQIYCSLQKNKINSLIIEATTQTEKQKSINIEPLLVELSTLNNKLYKNTNPSESIQFEVDRIPFDMSTIDPRVLTVKPNSKTELHSHAHESIFFVINGSGKVIIDNAEASICKNAFVHVPRWIPHQTINTGKEDLVVFAITDFNFTKRFPGNTADSYRQKKQDSNKNLERV